MEASNFNIIDGDIMLQMNTVSFTTPGFLRGVKWQAVHRISSLTEESHRVPETILFDDEGWPFGLHKLQNSFSLSLAVWKLKCLWAAHWAQIWWIHLICHCSLSFIRSVQPWGLGAFKDYVLQVGIVLIGKKSSNWFKNERVYLNQVVVWLLHYANSHQ